MPYEFIDEEPKQESGLGTLARGALRTGARVGEAVAGLPGDIASGVLGLSNLASRLAVGSEIPGVSTAQSYLPTSQKIREKITQPLTGEYLEPQGAFESGLDTLVGDVATLLTPGGIASKGASLTAKAVGKAGLKAAGAGIVGAGVESILGPEAGAFAKGMTLALGNTYRGRQALNKQRIKDYQLAESAIPLNAATRNIPLRTRIGHDIKVISKGISLNKNEMLGVLEGIKNNFDKQGRIKVQDLWNLKKNVNEWLSNPTIDKGVRSQLSKTVGDLNESLGKYAQTNPSFSEPFYRAEELHKGLNQATQFTNFLNKNATLQKALQNWTPLSALGYALVKGAHISPATIAKGVGISGISALGTREIARTAELFARSPIARKYYMNAIKASALGDVAATSKNIKNFDKIAAKFEKENPLNNQTRYEFLD